jgi:hypothetical protein
MNPLLQFGLQMYAGQVLPQKLGGGLIGQGISNAVTGWSGGDAVFSAFKDSANQPMARLQNTQANMSNEINTNLNKMAEKKTMEKISSADLAFIDDLIASTPLGGMQKTAGVAAPLKGWLNNPLTQNAMPILSTLALGSLGLSAGSVVYDKIKDAVKQRIAYNAMFEEFPELNDMPRTQVDKYWGVLSDFAPKLTTNPLVAGQFISNMASYGMRGIDHNIVGQLAKIQGDLRNSTGLNTSLGVLSNLSKSGYENVFETMTDMPDAIATTAPSINAQVTP